MTFYIYAMDEDHALELAGNGADEEFESPAHAARGYDVEVHEARKLFKVTVEESPR
jgi:hypothetical protein